MAITASLLIENEQPSGGTTVTTASISPAADSLILLFVATGDVAVSSVSGLSLTWTQAIAHQRGTSAQHGSIWWADAGASPGSGGVTINYAGTAGNAIWHVVQVEGADNSSPIAQSFEEEGSGTDSITLPVGVTSGNATFSHVIGNSSSSGTVAGNTALGTCILDSTPSISQMVQWDAAGAGTLSWTSPGSPITTNAIIEVAESSGPAGQTVTLTGIASAEAFGSPTITQGPGTQTVSLNGIASGEAMGQPTVTPGPVTVTLVGIASGEAFGQPTFVDESIVFFPEVTVEVAFASDPGDDPQVWTDLTEYCREVTVTRGRSRELDQFAAGTLAVTLGNEDRRFDPSYEDGDYYPNILPMRQVRVRAVWDEVTYDIFHGFVDGWAQVYQHPEEALAVLTATDGFKVLGNIGLPATPWEVDILQDAPIAWWKFNEAEGTTTIQDYTGNGWDLTLTGTPERVDGIVPHTDDGAMLFAGEEDNRMVAERAVGPIGNGPWTIELWCQASADGQFTGSNHYIFSQVLGAYDGEDGANEVRIDCDGGQIGASVWEDHGAQSHGGAVGAGRILDSGVTRHVVLTYDGVTNLSLWVDGIAGETDSTVGVLAIPAHTLDLAIGGTWGFSEGDGDDRTDFHGIVDDVVVYDYVLSDARIQDHYTAWAGDTAGTRLERILDYAEWSEDLRDLDTGVVPLQATGLADTTLGHGQKLEVTEQGLLFMAANGDVKFVDRDGRLTSPYTTVQATFGEDEGDLEFTDLGYVYDDLLIFNEVRVQREGGAVQVATDAASKARFLKRVRSLDGLLHQDDATSLDLARYILPRYAEPFQRVTGMTVEPVEGNGVTLYPQVLGRELGDRIRVKRRPQDIGTDIDQEAHIEGVTHTITPGRWVTQWNLSPADTREFWVVGTSALGTGTRLAF